MFSSVWLIIVMHLCAVGNASRRIFDTTIISENSNTFDCLIETNFASLKIYNEQASILPRYINEIRQYCRRSSPLTNHQMHLIESLKETIHPTFTFYQLRSMNVTPQQLFQWYAPTDLIEDYIAGKENDLFVNCSSTRWFGLKCEYTFDSDSALYLIAYNQSDSKKSVPDDLRLYTNGTCYEMNNTDCESVICLDWREICDGKIDCKNGYDELHCQALEINECDSSTELRCYDGQCVDNPLDINKLAFTCLEEYIESEKDSSVCNPTRDIICENLKCPRLFFSCGDGYCYDGPSIGDRSCPTQRDRRYLEQMSSLSLILFSHVMINYIKTQPQYICYNQTLCPYLSSNNHLTTTHNNGLTCRSFQTFTDRTYDQFDEMVKDVKRLVRSCSQLPLEYNNPDYTCSMFQCDDGSKCLSFHRLSNGMEDCTNGEDERQLNTCSYQLAGRFTCDNGTKCIPGQFFMDEKNQCKDTTDQNPYALALSNCSHPFSNECSRITYIHYYWHARFYHICNGVIEYVADLKNNTDESHCLSVEWPCDTLLSKCDGLWNCPDGRDELGCNLLSFSSRSCNNSEHYCLQNNTGDLICLPASSAGDGSIDCVGSFDEREFCRAKYPSELKRRYRCQNSNLCIAVESICDCQQDCPENDDETTACLWLYNERKYNHTHLQTELCYQALKNVIRGTLPIFTGLADLRNMGKWAIYQDRKPSSIATNYRVKRQSEGILNHSAIWSCNHGIYVRSAKDPEGFACFCPDHFYGHRCQYQRKRILINLQFRVATAFNQTMPTSTVVVLLVHTNQSNMTIISHIQFGILPRFQCENNYPVQLLYPIHEPYRSLANHSVHIQMFDRQTLRHQKSWIFSLSFEFLPVQHLSKRLDVPELDANVESRPELIPYNVSTLCSNNSRYIGYDVSLNQDVCICPPTYAGRRCLLPFDPCININCSGHGTCQPTTMFHPRSEQFICLCDLGWRDIECNQPDSRIYVSLAQDLTFLSSHPAFLHLIYNPYYYQKIHQIYADRFQKETLNITFIIDHSDATSHAAFIQFYEHQSKFDYYLLFYRTYEYKVRNEIQTEVQSTHRCRSITELFDADILAQPDIRRVKNYQQPCLHRHYYKDPLLCFYDDDLMCVCRDDNFTDCLNLQSKLKTCDNKWCNGRGMCVKDDEHCLTYSRCICEACAYGPSCQFSAKVYSLSLDGIIGSHILLTVANFSQQPEIVRSAVVLISAVIAVGIILNILSISTFIHKETHEVGCGLYLLASSIIGFLTPVVLLCKVMFLLAGERNHSSCWSVEFFLKWCPTSCEWLNACVAFERAIAVKRATQYSRSKSKYLSKWITPLVLIVAGCFCIPEFFFRGITIDPFDNRAWCVLTLNSQQSGLLILYSTLNILSFIAPLLINLSSGIIIILFRAESKQKINKKDGASIKQNMTWRTYLQLVRTQVVTHKHILIGPALLGILGLPRLVLTFIFVCTKLDQNSIPSLIAYLVAFLPSMAVVFAFVSPSETYRKALIKSIKTIIPNCVQNLFIRRN